MKKVKCFDKSTLRKANEIATERDYNRQLMSSFVNSLPDDKWFPIVFTMIHEHAQGKLVFPHIRCWVEYDTKGSRFFIDCDMKVYNNLQSFEIPEKENA